MNKIQVINKTKQSVNIGGETVLAGVSIMVHKSLITDEITKKYTLKGNMLFIEDTKAKEPVKASPKAKEDLTKKDLKTLRMMASKLKIKFDNQTSKDDLISLIEDKRK